MFDRLAKAKHFSEHDARIIMKAVRACDRKAAAPNPPQIAGAIHFLHGHNIAHRHVGVEKR